MSSSWSREELGTGVGTRSGMSSVWLLFLRGRGEAVRSRLWRPDPGALGGVRQRLRDASSGVLHSASVACVAYISKTCSYLVTTFPTC